MCVILQDHKKRLTKRLSSLLAHLEHHGPHAQTTRCIQVRFFLGDFSRYFKVESCNPSKKKTANSKCPKSKRLGFFVVNTYVAFTSPAGRTAAKLHLPGGHFVEVERCEGADPLHLLQGPGRDPKWRLLQ